MYIQRVGVRVSIAYLRLIFHLSIEGIISQLDYTRRAILAISISIGENLLYNIVILTPY